MRGSLILTLSQREGEFLNPKSKTTARTGWALEMEIDTQPCSAGRNGSVPAYSISHHELSTLKKAPSRSNSSSCSNGPSRCPDMKPWGTAFSNTLVTTDVRQMRCQICRFAGL